MPSEKFAEYLGNEMAQANESLKNPVAKIIRDESISSYCFANLTPDELESIFKDMEGIKYGFGVKKQFQNVQEQIKRQKECNTDFTNVFIFRPFLKPAYGTHYKKCKCAADHVQGLLDTVHYFSYPERQISIYSFAKESVRFATGCINARQNGTIHFGIKRLENGLGLVQGVNGKIFPNAETLMNAVKSAIKESFHRQEQQREVLQCLGPVLIIPVDKENVVIEIDVIPHYTSLSNEVYMAHFPPKGPQLETCFLFVKQIGAVDIIDLTRVDSMKREHLNTVNQRRHLDTLVNDEHKVKTEFLDLKTSLQLEMSMSRISFILY